MLMDVPDILSLIDISKSYDKKTVLDKVNVSVQLNNSTGIIGRNGAGKTTLIKIILGLLQASSGEVRYFGGQKLDNAVKKKIGFFIGLEYLPEELTGLQYLQFVNFLYNGNGRQSDENLLNLFEFFFEERDSAKKSISSYSFGMKQKIGICGALVNQPQLLILDEPFSGLDAFSCKRLIAFINKYRQNATVLISSHDLTFIEKICDHLMILEKNQIIYNDTLANFTTSGKQTLEDSLFRLLSPQDTNDEKINWLV
ncbi:ABC transporter ATP-binding protein [Chitinophaga qingshengii]|uniref:ABC transporter ATP-binding protein n=1 Tax=Chitinophaga qingshengii TaxID=1569794 RepID=A0ABR7TVE2_9BACT|nr:ABC transporter ATP-binding protein [Chitinophaga qingshengii]MBC9934461.1 ABC transporter ATP-binding protein [Chitinophaga qingshengii]